MESVVSQVMEKGIPGVVGHEMPKQRQDRPLYMMDGHHSNDMSSGDSSNRRRPSPSYLSNNAESH